MRQALRIIRNILLLAIAVIVILAGALAFNTLTHGSRQLQVAAVPRAAVDAQASAARLAEALRGMRAHIEGYADMIRFYRQLIENAAG